jgi:hypothetical protein
LTFFDGCLQYQDRVTVSYPEFSIGPAGRYLGLPAVAMERPQIAERASALQV